MTSSIITNLGLTAQQIANLSTTAFSNFNSTDVTAIESAGAVGY